MTTGAAKQDTTLPSEGVAPYQFGSTNIGKSIGKLAKNAANFKVQKAEINAARAKEMEKASTEGTAARRNVRSANKNIKALEGISQLSQQQFPSSPLSAAPKKRKPAAKKPAARKPAGPLIHTDVKGNITGYTHRNEASLATAQQSLAAGKKKAKQVRPQKKTSLSTNPL